MKSELEHFINDYLTYQDLNIYCYSKIPFDTDAFTQFVNSLKPFDAPDMYAILGEKVIIFEHFQFDGSPMKSQKGMRGIAEESKLNTRINEFYHNASIGTSTLDSVNYSQTSINYCINFATVYHNHYEKIPSYRYNLSSLDILPCNAEFYTGFFIENINLPQYYEEINNHIKIYDLLLLGTKQFLECFEHSPLLDFVFFGTLYNGRHQLFYIDKHFNREMVQDAVDLSQIEFHNFNDVTYAPKF